MHSDSSTWGPYFAALPEEGLFSKYTFPENYGRMLQSGVDVRHQQMSAARALAPHTAYPLNFMNCHLGKQCRRTCRQCFHSVVSSRLCAAFAPKPLAFPLPTIPLQPLLTGCHWQESDFVYSQERLQQYWTAEEDELSGYGVTLSDLVHAAALVSGVAL
jgi:hypothetical protein